MEQLRITSDTGVTNCWSLAGCNRCVLIEDTVLGGWQIIGLELNSRFFFFVFFSFLAILLCFKNSWASPESTLPMSINIPRGETEAWGVGVAAPRCENKAKNPESFHSVSLSPQHPHRVLLEFTHGTNTEPACSAKFPANGKNAGSKDENRSFQLQPKTVP